MFKSTYKSLMTVIAIGSAILFPVCAVFTLTGLANSWYVESHAFLSAWMFYAGLFVFPALSWCFSSWRDGESAIFEFLGHGLAGDNWKKEYNWPK